MKTSSKVFAFFSFTFFSLALGTASSQAETIQCKVIDVVPITISAPGVYCLKANKNTNITSGNAITINANNVVLDLNGFRLNGSASGKSVLTNGIFSQNLSNITIKNGTIEGYGVGIFLAAGLPSAAKGYVVEEIRAFGNFFLGMEVQGLGAIIRNNHVLVTGGSTAFGPNLSPAGIVASGIAPRVLNNDVVRVTKLGGGTATGITFAGFASSVDGLAVNNRITEADVGIFFAISGKFRDNLTTDVATPFVGGTDAGNND